MAQQDTGLGWSAKDTYLISVAGLFGSMNNIGGTNYPGQPIAKAQTAADIMASGFHVAESNRFNQYVGSDPDHDILVAVTGYSDYGLTIIYISASSGATAYTTSGSDVGEIPLNIYDDATGLYYNRAGDSWGINPPPTPLVVYAPTFSSIRDALDAVQVLLTNIYKLYAGYAVACFASWYTPAGVLITSPILISTEKLNTTISLDGTSVATQITESVAYNGRIFYMAYMTNLDGSPSSNVPILDLTQYGAAYGSKVFKLIAAESYANIQLTQSPPDPYEEQTDPSEEEGGDGSDPEDDPVEEETLPLPSVAGHGFCTIYVPSTQELGQMASYLWSGSFDIDQVIKLFSNPMDSILGLSAVPVDLVGTPEQIHLGGVALPGITMPKYTGRTSVKVDFGTATIEKRWGSYLDYEPYTEFSIYLPFIGIKPIKADDIMEKTISLTYAIDILSGGCVAYLRPAGGSVLYEWSGQCALQIPVTARNYDNVFQTAMSVVGAVGAAIVAPASAPVLSGAVASAAVQAAATKPRIERSGTVNGITGFLGQLRPYIIRTIPEAYIPADQNKFIGYPAYINVDLANVSGYNEVDSIHLENVTATGTELEEIESILKGGVIF